MQLVLPLIFILEIGAFILIELKLKSESVRCLVVFILSTAMMATIGLMAAELGNKSGREIEMKRHPGYWLLVNELFARLEEKKAGEIKPVIKTINKTIEDEGFSEKVLPELIAQVTAQGNRTAGGTKSDQDHR